MTERSSRFLLPLLFFGSGFCALVYQTVWLRQFRTIFGASTPATAAVIAIFMAGLGAGSLWFGRRAGRFAQPLAAYGIMEFIIALSAALSPALLALVRLIYYWSGGSLALGAGGAAVARLLLAALVLGVPTFLMGASFPLIVRSDGAGDRGPRVGLLYATNTLGAVAGVLVSTFFLLETFGNRRTMFIAAALNIGLAVVAFAWGRKRETVSIAGTGNATLRRSAASVNLVVGAAFAGFVFYAMEIVWYRMLVPLTGGTTYTFGIILALALLGIGSGSAIYARRRSEPSRDLLAVTFALEALALALPIFAGDGVATVALLLRGFSAAGFGGLLFSWTAVAAFVVLLPSIIAGYQFPLLVDLWRAAHDRPADAAVGFIYGVNTLGSIAGSIAAGFLLLPLLTAPGLWKVGIAMLVLFALVDLILVRGRAVTAVAAVLAAGLAVGSFAVLGPTAAWRHTPIAFGRAESSETPNDLVDDIRARRRAVFWEREGVESSVAMTQDDGIAFLVNGKSDGHARFDAGTQVMGALLGVLLHPNAADVMVVGLGTGSSAGWAAAAPTVRQVDVVEIEPVVREVAAECEPVNRGALSNPKVKIHTGDAREFLHVTPQRYDVIFSEPSNPSRMGVSSLFTSDFYREVNSKLRPNGIFLQWLQGYETDSRTVRSVYATLGSVFANVETWQTRKGDLLLVCTQQQIPYDLATLAARLQAEPFQSAVWNAWKIHDVSGLFAHYMADPTISQWLGGAGVVNTDDRNVIEYEFARNIGSFVFSSSELWVHAKMRRADQPRFIQGSAMHEVVEARQISMATVDGESPFVYPSMPPPLQQRARIHASYLRGDYRAVLAGWQAQSIPPSDAVDMLTFAHSAAEIGDPSASQYIGLLHPRMTVEANILRAIVARRTGDVGSAVEYLRTALTAARTNPWAVGAILARAVSLSQQMAGEYGAGAVAAAMDDLLSERFSVRLLEGQRRVARLAIARAAEGDRCGARTLDALSEFEPWVPWRREFLMVRRACYAAAKHPLAARAEQDYRAFLAAAAEPLDPKTE